MADTYEKDLGQKSSLTISDFIRVVGSDNVSYKQLVSDVLTVGATIDAKGSDKDLDTIYTNQRSDTVVLINGQNEANQATAAGIIHFVISFRRSSVYGSQWEFRGNEAYVRNISGSSWSAWTKMPTRAEIDALTSIEGVGFTAESGVTDSFYIRKKAGFVSINGYVNKTGGYSASAQEPIGTLPAGSRPAVPVRFPVAISSQAYNAPSQMGYGVIATDGTLSIKAASTTSQTAAYFSLSYIAQN